MVAETPLALAVVGPAANVVVPTGASQRVLVPSPGLHTGMVITPVATALAATRISDEQLAEVERHLDAMRDAHDDVERLNAHDAAFHRAVISATGNETLATVLEGVSGRTLRARIWRGLVDTQAAGRTISEHEAIFRALSIRDASLSQAAALMHVSNTAQWLSEHFRSGEALPWT